MSFLVRAVRPHPEVSGLNWAYVLVGVADGTLLPFIPLYLLERGMSAVAIGAVLAACAFAAVAGGLAWGYLADRRFSPERLVVLASVAAAATALLMLPFGGGTAIAVVIVMLTIARSPLTLLDPIVLRKLRVTSRTDYARIRLRMSAGWAASVIVAGATYQALGLRLIPLVYAPLSLLFGLWVWRRIHADGETAREEPAARTAVRVSRVPLALVGFLGSCFLLGVSLAATQNFLTLQISDLGGGALLVGAAAAFQALTEIPTMGYTHVLTRHLSHRVLFGIGCGIYLVIFVAWAFVSSALVAALLKLVIGVAFALTIVAGVMITNELTPSRLRATGQAVLKAVLFGVAPIAGALGGGIVYGALGPRVMFLASTVVVAAAGLLAVIAVPARKRDPVQQPPIAAMEAASPVIP